MDKCYMCGRSEEEVKDIVDKEFYEKDFKKNTHLEDPERSGYLKTFSGNIKVCWLCHNIIKFTGFSSIKRASEQSTSDARNLMREISGVLGKIGDDL